MIAWMLVIFLYGGQELQNGTYATSAGCEEVRRQALNYIVVKDAECRPVKE